MIDLRAQAGEKHLARSFNVMKYRSRPTDNTRPSLQIVSLVCPGGVKIPDLEARKNNLTRADKDRLRRAQGSKPQWTTAFAFALQRRPTPT